MKTSTAFWSLIVNTILYFIIRYCYNNIEGEGILLFFFCHALIVHWTFGMLYIYDDATKETPNNLLNWTFYLPSLITLALAKGVILMIIGTAMGVEKTFNQINKLLDS